MKKKHITNKIVFQRNIICLNRLGRYDEQKADFRFETGRGLQVPSKVLSRGRKVT
jgi:hypothetical protein